MRLFILGALIVVCVAVGLAMLKLYGQPASTRTAAPVSASLGVSTVDVLVARKNIPLGAVIDGSMVDKQPWPQNLVVPDFIISGTPGAKVEGMVARADFQAGEPLTTTKLAKPGEASFLAASLPKGMRAVTVATDAITGVAGYIFPGDRVDVVFTHSVPQDAPAEMLGIGREGMASKPTTSEVLIPDVRVLAVNIRKTETRDEQHRVEIHPTAEAPPNMTLEMSQEDVKKLRLAEKNGTLSLALRSLKDAGDESVGLPITLVDISRAEGGAAAEAMRALKWVAPGGPSGNGVVIIRGVKSDEDEHQAVSANPMQWPVGMVPPPGAR